MRLAVAALVAALALAPAAIASPATPAQVRALALAVQHDPAALERLKAIDSVDGQPVNMAALLGHAHGADLLARLRTLAEGGSPGSTPATRSQARQILRQRRFRGSSVPRPFHGVLVAIGNGIHWVLTPFRKLGVRGPKAGGGWSWLWGLVALAIIALAVFVVVRLSRRRGGLQIVSGNGAGVGVPSDDDPARLERRADEAERAGDLSVALRLRFRAGLLRLARKRVIPARSSVTTREVRAAVRSAEFDELARAFDEIVYGHRDARPDDLDRARSAWPRVVDSAGTSR